MKFTPSAGVGGHCIPVDPTYLADKAEELGISAKFIRHANEVNSSMAKYVAQRVSKDNGGSLIGKNILIVGVAYKPNVADVRETAAELVIEECRAQGAVVTWHDDLVKEWKGQKSSALQGSEIKIVITKHSSMNDEAIRSSAPYVFDTTGTVDVARKF
jgi:UDP-N-acetyl-D-glucosamine dehydrogenase